MHQQLKKEDKPKNKKRIAIIINAILFSCNVFLGLITFAVCYAHLFSALYLDLLISAILFLLLLNVLFGIFWIFRKPIFAIFTLVVLLVNCLSFPDFFQFNKEKEVVLNQKQVCLQTYNVHHFKDHESSNTIDAVLHLAEKNEVDILCIQEHAKSESYKEYKDYFSYHTPKEESVVIYSRYPIIHSEHINFIESSHSGTIADIVINDQTVRIISVHLQTTGISSNWRLINEIRDHGLLTHAQGMAIRRLKQILTANTLKRVMQADNVCELINQSPYHVILCGDFNDAPRSKTYRRIAEKLQDAFRTAGSGYGASYGSPIPFVRIDHVFHSKEIIPHKFTYQSAPLSDHRPAFFRFSLGN